MHILFFCIYSGTPHLKPQFGHKKSPEKSGDSDKKLSFAVSGRIIVCLITQRVNRVYFMKRRGVNR